MRFRVKKLLVSGATILVLCAGLLAQGPSGRPDVDVYGRLRFRHIGPEGNRVDVVVGVPGDSNVYYAGAASGGIWKTTDGGIHWDPIFDDQPVSSIGTMAIAPSDPNIVYAGTGEPFIRSHISVGEGMFKSTDAGHTWTRAGLEKTGRIARVVIDPSNPDVVLACALGHAYGPQQERGVFRTTNGGKTWDARCSSTSPPGARTWPSTRQIRASCSPACGRSRSTRGAGRAAVRGAVSMCPATVV